MRRHLHRRVRGISRASLVRIVAALLALAAFVSSLPQTVPPARALSPGLVISQVYGGGGNSGAVFTNDFIELFNRGSAPVSLAGLSVQYGSSTGNIGGTSGLITALPAVSVQPGQYFLIQQAAGATPVTPLPTPDATGGIAMSGSSGKVALVNGTTGLNCNSAATCNTALIIDLVGYGTAATYAETAPTGALANNTAAIRAGGGCAETDNNSADFAVATPTPRNTSSALNVCTTSPTNTPIVTNTPTNTPVVGSPTPTNTPGPVTRIREIQGAAHFSPLNGQTVTSVSGIVTAIRTDGTGANTNIGFYLQDPSPDADERTSEAVFVRMANGAVTVAVGDAVTVTVGTVREWRPGCMPQTGGTAWTDTCSTTASGYDNLTLTWLVVASNSDLTVASSGNPLPAATIIGAGGRVPPTTQVSDDVANIDTAAGANFDPANDGADFFESLEAMRVQVNNAVAVGPRTSNGEIGVLADNGAGASGVRTPRGGILYDSYADDQPERIILDDQIVGFAQMPAANVGATISTVVGVIDYSFANFKLHVTTPPVLASNPLTPETTSAPVPGQLTVASFNVENLTDGDPQTKFDTLAALIRTNMRAPDLIVLEEVQDNNGTGTGVVAADEVYTKLIQTIQSAGGPTYQYQQIDPVNGSDGGAPNGSIRVGFLFRTDRGLAFVPRSSGGLDCSTGSPTPAACATTAVTVQNVGGVPQLSLSPGRIAPDDSAWASSRKPLAGEFTFNGRTLFVVGNHFNSKGGDDPQYGRFDPPVRSSEAQRHQQAALVNGFVDQILAIDPNALVVVAGDFNDFDFSETLNILRTGSASGSGDVELVNLFTLLPANERYSYVFNGASQILDSILVSPGLMSLSPEYDVLHVNAEFAVEASDHDPSVSRFTVAAPPTLTPTPTNTLPPTETPTPTNTPTNTPVPPTNTPVPPTNTPTNTPVPPTNTPTNTPTPVPAGAIELRLAPGLPSNRAFRYDPPGPTGVQTQTFDGEPGCGQFAASPSLMQVTATAPNGQPRSVCLLAFRMGVDKGPAPGPLDNFRVNQGEKMSFALGSSPTVTGKTIRTAQIKVEGSQQAAIKVTAYNGATSVGSQTVPLSSLTPQGGGAQGNNYTVNVDFGQTFTRLEVEATAGSFSIVGGANNSGPTTFNLTQ